MANQQQQGQQGGGQQNQPQATADQGRFVNVIANLVVPKSKTSWTLIIILLLFLMIAWWKNLFGMRTVLLTFGVTISGIIAVCIILIFIVIGYATSGKRLANFYIASALLLWLVDLIPPDFWLIGPYLGPEWAGFVWPVQGIWHIPWASIVLSSFFFSLLYINMVFNIIEKEYQSFSLGISFILITNYIITEFFPNYINYGFNLYIPHGYTVLFNVGVIVVLVALGWAAWKLDKHRRDTSIPEFFSSVYMIFVFSFFWVNNGWQANLRAILHMIFILGFGFSYMRNARARSSIEWKIWMPTLLIIDFFGYGLLWASDTLILKFIPPVVLFVIIYCYEKEAESGEKNYIYPVFALVLLVTFFLIMSLKVAGIEEGTLPFVTQKGTTFKEVYYQFTGKLKEAIEGRLEYATGGLYRSQVEKNQFEPLGVFFDRVRPAQPRFYTDEDVTLWATIKSRTLSDPVFVNFTCFRWKDGKRIQINPKDEKKKDILIPESAFGVYTLEDKDVECTFTQDASNSKLQAGTNMVTLSATYNFATSAYQKTYFIDRDRQRAMVRENLDPLKEFGIADRKPVTAHTNGPVEVAVDVQPLTPVSDSSSVNPALGILLKNRDKITDKQGKPFGEWQGKIKKINELVIVLPKGITIDEKSCRPVEFNKIDDKNFCDSSCISAVYSRCIDKCSSYPLDSSEQLNCIQDCSKGNENIDADKKCKEDCNSIFKSDSGEQDYTGYKLNIEQLEKRTRDEYKDIDKFKTFLCRIIPTKDTLENVPITTKFIRVRARYDYLLEKTFNVLVEQAPAPSADADSLPFIDVEIPRITARPAPEFTYTLSNIDIDMYFKSKNSELAGIGQCIKDAEHQTKVPPTVILAVANHESKDFGPDKLSGLAKLNYNLFGIKCSNYYKDNLCAFSDKKQCCKGYSKTSLDIIYEPTAPNVYRAYPNYCESVKDFANLIANSDRYREAMQYTSNPEEMLKRMGRYYATDPAWADKVISRMRTVQTDLAKATAIAATGTKPTG